MTSNSVAVIRYQYDNHLGSASLELDENADIISYEEHHFFGTTSYRSGRTETETSQKRYKYVGKERDEETGLYYYGFRYYAAWLCRFVSVDPLQFDYPHYTPFQYAGNKPISYIDLDGLEEAKNGDEITNNGTNEKQGAYKMKKDNDGNVIGFEWDDENAYDEKGKLNKEYYEKAIIFKDNPNKIFNLNSKWSEQKNRYYGSNLGSAIAEVLYKDKDGNKASKTFNACTRPSDPNYFATVKEGFYNAKYGTHKSKPALNLINLEGTSWKIPTVGQNPSKNKGINYATGINIHKAGSSNYTSSIWSLEKIKVNGKIRAKVDSVTFTKHFYDFSPIGVNQKNGITFENKICLSHTYGQSWNYERYSGISEGCFLIDNV